MQQTYSAYFGFSRVCILDFLCCYKPLTFASTQDLMIRKKKIVIVEDHLIIQELHKQYVEDLGHEVVACFTTGEEAIHYFQDSSADLVLMDIRLEDAMDGIEVTKRIQELKPVPVVYITGNTEDSNFRRAMETSMAGFISKPVSQSELENVIDSLNDLTSSIIYAEKIQKAIFPQRKDFDALFENTIHINRPMHIIGGDFPFLQYFPDNQIIVGGLGDCTGHGIPAALLSVLCHEIISNVVRRTQQLTEIAHDLNAALISNLAKMNNAEGVNDSLDLIVFKIDIPANTIQITGFKMGFVHWKSLEQQLHYHKFKGRSLGVPMNHEDVQLVESKYEADDQFFFYSDGITDQFGGPSSKKLSTKGLLSVIQSVMTELPHNREREINLLLRRWQGMNVQTDDMLMLGISPWNIKHFQ
jgi:CheY-like chemotaxis protein